MQALLLPAGFSGVSSSAAGPFSYPKRLHLRPLSPTSLNLSFSPPKSHQSLAFSFPLSHDGLRSRPTSFSFSSSVSSSPISSGYTSQNDESVKIAQVVKRLEKTARYFKRLGSWGFWGQLVCTLVAAVILSFSVVATGRITSPVSFYATAGGIVAAFISVFFSFGYIRLSEKLRRSANDPAKAPPRADVVKSIKNALIVNILGMGAAILGMQATVGYLVAKALTTSATPYSQGIPPILGLDVFLIQASANAVLSHFLGLAFSLELLRSVTLPPKNGNLDTPVLRVA